jgi:inhibitor of cysteine peptidase
MLFRFLTFFMLLTTACACSMQSVSDDTEPNQNRESRPMTNLLEKDNGRTIDIPEGSSFLIELPENATTGYQWAVDRFSEEFVELVSTEPHYASGPPGSGGKVEFVFRAKKAGSAEIALKQWRQWEGDASVIHRFNVHVNVRP